MTTATPRPEADSPDGSTAATGAVSTTFTCGGNKYGLRRPEHGSAGVSDLVGSTTNCHQALARKRPSFTPDPKHAKPYPHNPASEQLTHTLEQWCFPLDQELTAPFGSAVKTVSIARTQENPTRRMAKLCANGFGTHGNVREGRLSPRHCLTFGTRRTRNRPWIDGAGGISVINRAIQKAGLICTRTRSFRLPIAAPARRRDLSPWVRQLPHALVEENFDAAGIEQGATPHPSLAARKSTHEREGPGVKRCC